MLIRLTISFNASGCAFVYLNKDIRNSKRHNSTSVGEVLLLIAVDEGSVIYQLVEAEYRHQMMQDYDDLSFNYFPTLGQSSL